MLTAFPRHICEARQQAVLRRMAAEGVDALIVNLPAIID